ncbi:MAG: hypothetical protein ACJZ6A_06595 [Candidatus Poseidoniaceae archaeon]
MQVDEKPNSEHVFIHISDCPESIDRLKLGMMFEFDAIESLKKPGTFVGKNLIFLGMANEKPQTPSKIEKSKRIDDKKPEEILSKRSNKFLVVRAKNLIRGSGADLKVEEVRGVVERGGAALVLLMSGDNLGPRKPQKPHLRSELVKHFLDETFTGFSTMQYEGKHIDLVNKSHPLISEMCVCAYIVSKDGLKDYDGCEKEILKLVYEKLRRNANKRWTIIGDETGQFNEFNGKPGNDGITSTMLWVAIPPNTKLPNLSPHFHGTTSTSALLAALKSIDENPNIMIYSFSFEEGNIALGAGKVAKDPHLSMWSETLPLVLESISNRNSKKVGVDIFSERVKELEPGMNLFETTILDLKTALNDRISWAELNFEDMKILAKKPCEHPWMGYPDALGHLFNKKKMKKLEKSSLGEILQRIQGRIITSPFRQKSLNSLINPSIKRSGNPMDFLKSLYGYPVEDIRDYVIPFFVPAIMDSLNALDQQGWQKLLSFMKQNSEDGKNQNVSKVIHSLVNIDLEIGKLTQNSDKFDFALAMLGTSNHIGARNQAEKCITICHSLIENGFIPRKDRAIKFDNLSGGKKDNEFNFDHIDSDLILPNDTDYDDEWAKYLGAQALSHALSGTNLDFAIEIEDYLLRNTSDYEQLERRYLMSAELKFEVGEIEEGLRLLEKKLPNHVGKSVKELISSNIYYLPSLLKGCVLNGRTKGYFQEYTNSIDSKFNFEHPSQRTAYWCARWSEQLGNIKNPASVISRDYIIQLIDRPKFTHDAPGVILACELLDLVSRNLIDFDASIFLDKVLENSVDSTKQWVGNNQPNEYDWLAPLNFNYR